MSDEEQELFKYYEYRNHVYRCQEYRPPSEETIIGHDALSQEGNRSYHHHLVDENGEETKRDSLEVTRKQARAAAYPYQGSMVMENQSLSLSLSLDQSIPTGRNVYSLCSKRQSSHRPRDHHCVDKEKLSPAIITLKEAAYCPVDDHQDEFVNDKNINDNSIKCDSLDYDFPSSR